MGHGGQPMHGACGCSRPSVPISATIGEVVRLGGAVAQLGIAVVRRVMGQGSFNEGCHGRGEARGCCGGCACDSVCVHDCVECRPRVYPRGCCQ